MLEAASVLLLTHLWTPQTVQLDLKPILSLEDIPTGVAVHGTTAVAWKTIGVSCFAVMTWRRLLNTPTTAEKEGLSRMKRNHIHLAQAASTTDAISGIHILLALPLGTHIVAGLRKSAQILIYIDIPKALSSGLQFFLSDNGVVLTEGDDTGHLKPEFFLRVENTKHEALPCWEGVGPIEAKSFKFESMPPPGPNGFLVGKEDAISIQTTMENLTVTERVERE